MSCVLSEGSLGVLHGSLSDPALLDQRIIEMENPGEVSQILSGITFDRNNIF